MNRKILLTAGITGMLLGYPVSDTLPEVNIHIGAGERETFYIDRRPDFIELRDPGFSISVGSPYDIIYYGDSYYLFNNGYWYRSSHYRGPWIGIHENHLPYRIRRYSWDDIRRYREVEYRGYEHRHDHRDHHNDRGRHDGGKRH